MSVSFCIVLLPVLFCVRKDIKWAGPTLKEFHQISKVILQNLILN